MTATVSQQMNFPTVPLRVPLLFLPYSVVDISREYDVNVGGIYRSICVAITSLYELDM